MKMEWQPIVIDGKEETFLISIVNKSNDLYQFNLTNLKELWSEEIEWHAILYRAKVENPIMNVNSEEAAIQRTIFSPAKHYQCATNTADDTELVLKTKYYIGCVPFHLTWKLTKRNADQFYEEITRKLLVTLLNVQDQRTELFEVIKRKDAEIAQYKIEGATLSRKQVATQPFLTSEFDGKFELMSNSSLFAGVSNSNVMKQMCNYGDRMKGISSSVATVDVPEKPSPSKMIKTQKKREENAMRKFQSKRECKIQYESSCELLVDEEMEQDTNVKSDKRTDATADTKQCTEAPKKKLRSKLNL